MRLVIELIVDCMRCAKSVTIYSTKTEITGNPLAEWKPTKTGWLCPEEEN